MASAEDLKHHPVDENSALELPAEEFFSIQLPPGIRHARASISEYMEESSESVLDRRIRFGDEEESAEVQPTPVDYTYRPSIRLSTAIPRMECESFLNVEEFSRIFVEKIIKDASTNHAVLASLDPDFVDEEYDDYNDDDRSSYGSSSITNTTTSTSSTDANLTVMGYGGATVFVISWPSTIEFNEDVGVTKIDDFLSYWYLQNEWKYCVFFRGANSDRCSDFYGYEAIFSIPCRQYPIPQATASVYFTVEASRVKPNCPVEVTYHFEGKRLLHTPSSYEFQESWLFDIIDSKVKVFQSLQF